MEKKKLSNERYFQLGACCPLNHSTCTLCERMKQKHRKEHIWIE